MLPPPYQGRANQPMESKLHVSIVDGARFDATGTKAIHVVRSVNTPA